MYRMIDNENFWCWRSSQIISKFHQNQYMMQGRTITWIRREMWGWDERQQGRRDTRPENGSDDVNELIFYSFVFFICLSSLIRTFWSILLFFWVNKSTMNELLNIKIGMDVFEKRILVQEVKWLWLTLYLPAQANDSSGYLPQIQRQQSPEFHIRVWEYRRRGVYCVIARFSFLVKSLETVWLSESPTDLYATGDVMIDAVWLFGSWYSGFCYS